ncbi:MAG: tRNA (cytosine(32)/uridine(32)-2'-O)-methyltransferase TrmJ [Candidatus Rifleibacteriota bacterium]
MPESSTFLDRIQVVLVEPQGSLNVGAACRAMKNFGLSRLTVVRPGCELDLDAVKMAMHAQDILKSTRIVDTIAEAVQGDVLVLGTANRRGDYHEPNMTVQEGIQRISEVIPNGTVTIMFGREEWGLTKEDLKHAMGTIRIVTAPENTSLNLAQAVLLIAYELYQKFGDTTPMPKLHADDPYEQPPTAEEFARFYNHAESVLEMCEFLPKVNPDALMQVIRAFFHRSKPVRRELNILMGVFTNIRGFMKKYVYRWKNREKLEEALLKRNRKSKNQ